jgi:LysR family transcriptional regulator, carnitine catabolism transcriptional activator
MELRQLRSLCFIVKHGSLKEAAKRSFLTPAAVSLQIKGLEQELGVKIFELKGRKLTLTTQGEVFYYEARKVLEAVHEASEKAKHPISDFSGKIFLAAPACLRYYYLPSFARFRATYPSIKLTIFARNYFDASAMVRSGEADLAMGLFPHPLVDLEEIPLITPKLTLVLPRHSGRMTARELGLKELSRHRLVLLQPFTTTRTVIEGAFRKKNLSLRPEMEASTCMEVKRYVANAIGAGIVHDICLDPEDSSRFRTISLENIISHPRARLVYHPSKTLSPSEKKFIEFIRFAS